MRCSTDPSIKMNLGQMHSVDNKVRVSEIILSVWVSFLFSAVRLEFSELSNNGMNLTCSSLRSSQAGERGR